MWTETAISYNAKLAVISSEDQLFPDHNGFDWKSIKKAMAYNKRKPGRIHGASTISQQVAKNVFLWQGKKFYTEKGLEAYFTFMIELIWGKKRILEMYLNVIEMGDGIFGIEMAAQKYFNKRAKYLTRAGSGDDSRLSAQSQAVQSQDRHQVMCYIAVRMGDTANE